MCSENATQAAVAYKDPDRYTKLTRVFPVVQRVLAITSGLPNPDTLVDLCSGPGTLTDFTPKQLLSYDISPEMCSEMRRQGATATCCDITDGFSFPSGATVLFVGSACLFRPEELVLILREIFRSEPDRIILSLDIIPEGFKGIVAEVSKLNLYSHDLGNVLPQLRENKYDTIIQEDMKEGWSQAGFTIPSTILVLERAA